MENNASTQKYRDECHAISQITLAQASQLARHKNPVMRDHVAPILIDLMARHDRGNYQRVADEQSVDQILYYANSSQILKSISEVMA